MEAVATMALSRKPPQSHRSYHQDCCKCGAVTKAATNTVPSPRLLQIQCYHRGLTYCLRGIGSKEKNGDKLFEQLFEELFNYDLLTTSSRSSTVLQCWLGCYSRSSMSTSQLSQRCGCQTLVSELTRRTTFKVQIM